MCKNRSIEVLPGLQRRAQEPCHADPTCSRKTLSINTSRRSYVCIQAQKSARFEYLIFSHQTAPSEGRDPCGMCNYFISNNRSVRLWLMTLLNFLSPLGGDRRLHEPQPTNSVPMVGVCTPCGAVSTRGITVFVPSLSEL